MRGVDEDDRTCATVLRRMAALRILPFRRSRDLRKGRAVDRRLGHEGDAATRALVIALARRRSIGRDRSRAGHALRL